MSNHANPFAQIIAAKPSPFLTAYRQLVADFTPKFVGRNTGLIVELIDDNKSVKAFPRNKGNDRVWDRLTTDGTPRNGNDARCTIVDDGTYAIVENMGLTRRHRDELDTDASQFYVVRGYVRVFVRRSCDLAVLREKLNALL